MGISMPIDEQIKRIMADILGLEPAAISPSMSMHNTSEWDSLHHINLISALEQEFDTVFEVDEIQEMISFQEIIRHIGANHRDTGSSSLRAP